MKNYLGKDFDEAHALRRIEDLEKKLDDVYAKNARLTKAITDIANWREDAKGYDKDMGNPERKFCGDVELIENFANLTIEQNTDDG